MRRCPRSGLFLKFGLAVAIMMAASSPGLAQWAYPRRFGGYGWNRWGADPGAGYMAASGAYARGQGAYDVELAKAQSIERDSLIKWNKALMAQRRVLDAKKSQKDAQDQAEARVEIATNNLHNGSTLNDLLERILETDPTVTRVAVAKAPVTPELIPRDPVPDRLGTDLALPRSADRGRSVALPIVRPRIRRGSPACRSSD